MRCALLAVAVVALSGCRCGTQVKPSAKQPLVVTPSHLDYGSVYAGVTRTQTLDVRNPNLADVTVPLSVASPFSVPGTLTVPAGALSHLSVAFAPTAAGVFSQTLQVDQTAVALSATALAVPDCGIAAVCHAVGFDLDAGACSDVVLPDGSDCTAQLSCFAAARCEQGVCQGTLVTCDDNNRCTLDVCGSLGCGHLDDTGSCPFPSDPCQVPSCEPATGCGFTAAPDGTPCGARDCTTAHVCLTGSCQVRPAPQTLGCADVLAGLPGGYGWVDGVGTDARLSVFVSSLARDSAGALWVADTGNEVLRKVTPGGVVTTVAGTLHRQGLADGFGIGAKFDGLRALTFDLDGTLLVADNFAIRRVTPQGLVTTFVGSSDAGTQDGIGAQAGFAGLLALSVDSSGVLWAVDGPSQVVIRRISKLGEVTTLGPPFQLPGFADLLATDAGLLLAAHGIFRVEDDGGHTPVLDGAEWALLASTLDGGTVAASWNANGALVRLEADGGSSVLFTGDDSPNDFVAFDDTRWAFLYPGRIVLSDGVNRSVLAGFADPRQPSNGPASTAGLQAVSGVGALSDGGVVFCDSFGVRELAAAQVFVFGGVGPCDDLAVMSDDSVVTSGNLTQVTSSGSTPLSYNATNVGAFGDELAFIGSGGTDLGLFDGPISDAGFRFVQATDFTNMGGLPFTATDLVPDGDGGYFILNEVTLEHRDHDAGVVLSSVALGFGAVGLARDSAGNLFTVDNNLYQLIEISPSGTMRVVAQLADSPRQVAVEPSGSVLVTVPDAVLRIHP